MHSMPNREPVPCDLIRIACPSCGPVRMAIPPNDMASPVECPYCSQESPAKLIGTGRTSRLLPYFEMESKLQQFAGHPPPNAGFARLVRGQLVVYCQEHSILHFATINEVWTNASNLSPAGIPAVSFVIGGIETLPIKHISGTDGQTPFWCLGDELPKPETQKITAKPEKTLQNRKRSR